MNKIFVLLTSMVVVSGCVTSKPKLPDSQYSAFAERLSAVHQCGVKGYISPSDGASGLTYAKADLDTWLYDTARMMNTINAVEGTVNPSQGDCNSIAMTVAQRRNEINETNQFNQQQQQAWQNFQQSQPKTTTCNQIGTQTFCSTY